MNVLQMILVAGGLTAFLVLGYMLVSGPSAAKAGARRLQAVRYRHSENAIDRVEAPVTPTASLA